MPRVKHSASPRPGPAPRPNVRGMSPLPLEPGTLADWVAALAAVLGCILSIFALRVALAANRTADETRQEAVASARDSATREAQRDEVDRARDRRQLAGSVASWWAADRDESGRRYGVVVSNQSPTSAVFYDVEVHVAGPGENTHIIRMKVLPPGQFFVQNRGLALQSSWDGIPRPVREADVLDPFTVAGDRSITRLEYADGLGTRWRWTPGEGLVELSPSALSAARV